MPRYHWCLGFVSRNLDLRGGVARCLYTVAPNVVGSTTVARVAQRHALLERRLPHGERLRRQLISLRRCSNLVRHGARQNPLNVRCRIDSDGLSISFAFTLDSSISDAPSAVREPIRQRKRVTALMHCQIVQHDRRLCGRRGITFTLTVKNCARRVVHCSVDRFASEKLGRRVIHPRRRQEDSRANLEALPTLCAA